MFFGGVATPAVSNMRPARGSHVAPEHQKNEKFERNIEP